MRATGRPCARHTHGRCGAHEPAGCPGGEGEPLDGGARGHQKHPVQPVGVGRGHPLGGLVRDQVRGDQACATCCSQVPREGVDPVAQDRVPVGHHQDRHAGRGDRRDGSQGVHHPHPTGQRLLDGALDDGAVHHGVRVRHPQLYDVDARVDVVELGVPYSDPVMDGPVIQRAVERALAGGVRVVDTLRTVAAVASTGVPILVMTYWNPVLRYGVDAFARDLAAAGGAGLITPDLIPDEAAEWMAASDANGLDRVFLVAPSSTVERLALTARASRGFVSAASTMGVTGARATVGAHAEALVADARQRSPLRPSHPWSMPRTRTRGTPGRPGRAVRRWSWGPPGTPGPARWRRTRPSTRRPRPGSGQG